jgi:hypothetical protein
MSFDVLKSERQTETLRLTPSIVGPGAYDLQRVPFQDKKIGGFAPFSSMSQRFQDIGGGNNQ